MLYVHGSARADRVTAIVDSSLDRLGVCNRLNLALVDREAAGLAANLAVQLPSRRRDAASLRVVGVTRRSVMVGVVAEFLVVLGAAALSGVAAGALAQYVVVRTVTLGYADTELTPRVLPSFHVRTGLELSVVVMLVLLVLASMFAILTVRGARTSSLRENAR